MSLGWIYFILYSVFAIIVGFSIGKASLRVLRNQTTTSRFLKWILFPMTMEVDGNPTDILTGDEADFNLLGNTGISEYTLTHIDEFSNNARMKYLIFTCIFLPLRLIWILLIGGTLLVYHLGVWIWKRSFSRIYKRMAKHLTCS